MKWVASLPSLIAALPAVRGIAFGGPTPTVLSPERALDGTSPVSTIPPSNDDLKKRQTNLDPETCGWVNGIYSLGVTCPGSLTCMLYTSGSGMAGCCSGTNTIDCGWASSCIDAAAYQTSGCGSGCLLNSFIRKCTEATKPYCVTWSYPSDGILDYGCAANSDSSVSTILQRATDAFGASTSMTLPTVTAGAVNTDTPTTSSTRVKTTRKLAIGLIIGIVIAALFVLSCIAVFIFFLVKKKKKARQIAVSAQAMAAVHATRPQSQYPSPQQTYDPTPQQQQQVVMQTQMQRPSLCRPSIDPQSPVSATSYFPTGTHVHEEKPGAHTSVHEYAMTPISSPATPAPVYTQPHGVPPPVPVVNQDRVNAEAHEADAVSVPHVPGQVGRVHEMGSEK